MLDGGVGLHIKWYTPKRVDGVGIVVEENR